MSDHDTQVDKRLVRMQLADSGWYSTTVANLAHNEANFTPLKRRSRIVRFWSDEGDDERAAFWTAAPQSVVDIMFGSEFERTEPFDSFDRG